MNEQFTLLPRLRIRLSETMAWCSLSRRGNLARSLGFLTSYLKWRAARLSGKAEPRQFVPLSDHLRSPVLDPGRTRFPEVRAEQVSIVEGVADRRAEQLRLKQHYPSDIANDLQGGRLLLYSPDENLCDGAARYTSKGFFDFDNIPPWDTWVCFFQQYLVSWVPPQLLELANQGIDANPEGCIAWAQETELSKNG
jgi:hypothetical protein